MKVNKNRMLVAKNGQLGLENAQHVQQIGDPQDREEKDEDSFTLTSILRELSTTVKKLERQLDKMETDRKATENKVSVIEIVQQQETAKVEWLRNQVENQQEKIDALIDTVVRQDQQIQTLTNQINSAYTVKNQKNIIINGIPETQGENCFHEVAHFLKHALGLDKVQLKYAKRMGKGQYRPMLIRLANINDKSVIFQNIQKLKQFNQGKQRPYYITDQLPDAWAERKRFIHHLKQQNQKLPVTQQKKMEVKNNAIFFDDQEYKPPIRALTVSEFLNLSPERRKIIRNLEVIKGDEETKMESIFVGYATDIFSLKQVEDYYFHIRLLSPEATHVMCAYKLPGIDFTKVQGGIDDGEHGASRTLLNLLNKSMQVNKAVFVARYYGGRHLGPQRFACIENAANSALEKLKQHLVQMRKPPTQQELDDFRARMTDVLEESATTLPAVNQEQSQDTDTADDDDVQSIDSQESLR